MVTGSKWRDGGAGIAACDVSHNRARSMREGSPLDLLWVGVWATCASDNCTKTLSI